MTSGRVYLVGAGPGDPGLLTLRGAELLGRADVIIHDRLASQRLLRHARAGAERIDVGKQPARAGITQDEINRLMVERARSGQVVVRLKGGDPLIFGRGGEEAMALSAAGVEFEIVPGVTAVSAAAAGAGVPVTQRGVASCLGLVTGHEAGQAGEGGLDWSALAAWPGTLAFYMAAGNLEAICRRLVEAGADGTTPAAVVQWAGTAQQRVVAGALGDIAAKVREAELGPPVVVLVGKVVSLREQIAWFEKRALFGVRIAVTRPARQAEELSGRLEELGAAVIECPTIAILPPADAGPLRQAVARVGEFDWIVFASANAVEAFFAALGEAGGDARALAGCRLCCIGPVTARRLGEFGLRADLEPGEATGAAAVEAMAGAADLRGAAVLYPRSDIAPDDVPAALAARGARVTSVEAYRTAVDAGGAERLGRLVANGQVDWISLASASAVAGMLAAVDAGRLRGGRVRLASIGTATSAALRRAGLEPSAEAGEHTAAGLAAAIAAACGCEGAR